MMKPDRILVTGASSGIGEALARALSRPGATLILVARDDERLQAVAEACRADGAEVHAHPIDVTARDAMTSLVLDAAPLDLVVASAGVAYGIDPDGTETARQVRETLAINVDGVLNTALPALAAMRLQSPGPDGVRGRLVVIASVAAFLPYPNSPAYCASKAAVDTWTVATAPNAARDGILLTSVCPGFVRTPMTEGNDFPMPGLLEVEDAAARILRGVAAGRRRVVFPGWIGAGSRLLDLLPAPLRELILRRQPSTAPAPMPLLAPASHTPAA